MPIRSLLSRSVISILGAQTDRLRQLDQRRRFRDFTRDWKDVPLVDFSYEERGRFYRHVYEIEVGEGPIDYVEFGCFQGESMRAWCAVDTHPESCFWGFDSFEGLPENWNASAPEGTFSVKGAIPEIDDSRVTFIKGWFQDSLPPWRKSVALNRQLILHMDADLYSSTLFALVTINPPAGTLIFFDEFNDVMHEFRAFEDFLSACNKSYEVVATRKGFGKIAIRLK